MRLTSSTDSSASAGNDGPGPRRVPSMSSSATANASVMLPRLTPVVTHGCIDEWRGGLDLGKHKRTDKEGIIWDSTGDQGRGSGERRGGPTIGSDFPSFLLRQDVHPRTTPD